MEFNADSSHDIWDESDAIDTETMDKKLRNAISTKHQRGYGRLCKSLIDTFQNDAVLCLGIFILKVDGQGG